MKRRFRPLQVMLIPEEGGEARGIRLSARVLRILVVAGGSLTLAVALMATTWWYFALEAAKGWRQESLLDSLQTERGQILQLAQELERIEDEYAHLRSLFGPTADPVAPDLWLPPAGLPGTRAQQTQPLEDATVPSAWPLTEVGYVTQPLIAGGAGEHPGLDIAVATDSYIRASGGGRVLRIGEDPIYGLFMVLDHGGGYQTVYAHASLILVGQGQEIRRGEVIGLTGSSGRSTAPHLHFEVLLDGLPVDPLTLVEQPG